MTNKNHTKCHACGQTIRNLKGGCWYWVRGKSPTASYPRNWTPGVYNEIVQKFILGNVSWLLASVNVGPQITLPKDLK